MKKKLDTRFPAARIKRVMQSDEDIGKMALAVPVLVSKSLELFLQDLCDRTYEITLERGAKIVTSLNLKHCVERYAVFDFLREVVSKVPDYGNGDATMDDRRVSKKRKPINDEANDSDEEHKKSKTEGTGKAKPSGRDGRLRGRGKGRGGRAAKTAERESLNREMELDTPIVEPPPPQDSIKINLPDSSPQEDEKTDAASNEDTKQNLQRPKESNDFDLNDESLNLNETRLPPVTATAPAPDPEEYPGWPSMMDMDKLDPIQLIRMGKKIDEDEEDYDEED